MVFSLDLNEIKDLTEPTKLSSEFPSVRTEKAREYNCTGRMAVQESDPLIHWSFVQSVQFVRRVREALNIDQLND